MIVSPNARPPAMRPLILWIIWGAILAAVLIVQLILGHGIPSGKNAPGSSVPPIAFVALAEVVAATVIRWLWLPRLTELRQKFVVMVIGLALAEGSNFFGLFLVGADQPETKRLIFFLAVIGVLQFMPTYAREPVAEVPRV